MRLQFTERGWEEYMYWQSTDKAILKKLNELIKECLRHPFDGKGSPEPLKYEFEGLWSRRINLEHRLIYKVGEDFLEVQQCRFHYQK